MLYNIINSHARISHKHKIHGKLGFVHCCYYDKIYLQLIDDMGGLRLQQAIENTIQ